MCGIAGAVQFKEKTGAGADLQAMMQTLGHRGPDARGQFREGPVQLGHTRLSIIDLSSAADQPMADHTGGVRIVFNGEIYNYRELRVQLAGYPFRTNSDTETILAAYQKWGTACLSRLAGMFAFAIWDTLRRELVIVRDRLGVKPLYYFSSSGDFIFASEIRALLASGIVPRKLNYAAVAGFLQTQSVIQPDTIIKGVQALEAGSFMIVDKDGVHQEQYWQVGGRLSNIDFSDRSAVKKKVATLLSQSVERRMVSDVPVAAFLSGGIDSSAIVALMSQLTGDRVNTFTIGFDEKDYDESDYAATIAAKFNTRHELIRLKPTSLLEEILPALQVMDTPTGDGVNSYVVSKAIRGQGIKVALSGVGGDELFGGYPIFRQYLQLRKLSPVWKLAMPLRLAAAKFFRGNDTRAERYRQLLSAEHCDITAFYPVFRQIISPAVLAKLTSLPDLHGHSIVAGLTAHVELEKLPLLSQVSVAEYLGYTRNTLLADMDQTSMAVSLEVREPFFDHELVEFVLNVPDEQKLGKHPKNLLVESLQALLPLEVVTRKKQGFLFPWNVWMKKELLGFCDDHIRSVAQRDFINEEALLDYWQRFQRGDQTVRWLEIWLFVVLDYWLNKNGVE